MLNLISNAGRRVKHEIPLPPQVGEEEEEEEEEEEGEEGDGLGEEEGQV